jgi:hypothetical protein
MTEANRGGIRLSNVELSKRVRLIRTALFGEHGGDEVARALGLPAQTWSNYESGVTIPGHVLLGFIVLTSVDPRWLLTGLGPRFAGRPGDKESLRPREEAR